MTSNSTFLMLNSATCLQLRRRWRALGGGMIHGKGIANFNYSPAPRSSSVTCCLDKGDGFTSESFPRVEVVSRYDAASDNIGRQLKALDSYFDKLPGGGGKKSASRASGDDFKAGSAERDCGIEMEAKAGHPATDSLITKKELGSLENYFTKLNHHVGSARNSMKAIKYDNTSKSNSIRKPSIFNKKSVGKDFGEDLNAFTSGEENGDDNGLALFEENKESFSSDVESSDFSLINLLASINIAVFLFEIASPVRDSNFEQLSIPLLYGAKVNSLILDGEWWRLVTPMFLHSGLLHVVLSCWVLLTFGPQVCRGYGPLAFLLIYMLGGVCANITSFIHTSDLTVCGTGPIFAVIGAWLVYQFQNKETISKVVSEDLYRKAVLATALSFLLGYTGPTDEWTHLSAAISGLIYGFFTCPTLQLNNIPPGNQKEGVALLRGHANPCKSLLTFVIFILALCSLVFMFDPNPDMLEVDKFFVV